MEGGDEACVRCAAGDERATGEGRASGCTRETKRAAWERRASDERARNQGGEQESPPPSEGAREGDVGEGGSEAREETSERLSNGGEPEISESRAWAAWDMGEPSCHCPPLPPPPWLRLCRLDDSSWLL